MNDSQPVHSLSAGFPGGRACGPFHGISAHEYFNDTAESRPP